jgi:hypothetical protein
VRPSSTPLTTTISELNRLYGLYEEAVSREAPDGIEISKTWFAYLNYCHQFKTERGLPTPVDKQLKGR